MRPRLRIELPRMSAGQAIDFLDVLQRVSEAVWRAYGHQMAAHLRLAGSTCPPQCGDPDHSDDRRHHDDQDPDVEF